MKVGAIVVGETIKRVGPRAGAGVGWKEGKTLVGVRVAFKLVGLDVNAVVIVGELATGDIVGTGSTLNEGFCVDGDGVGLGIGFVGVSVGIGT